MNYFKWKKSLAIGFVILSSNFVISEALADSFDIATWNIAWLSSDGYPQFEQSMRSKQDFKKLTDYFHQLDVPILAFQEIDSAQVIQKVVGSSYQVFLSQRSEAKNARQQFDDINQYTGFAVASHIKVTDYPDLDLNADSKGKLRFATHIAIKSSNDAKPIHLLSVHLKAGCQGKYRDNRSCRILKAQSQRLANWIKQRQVHHDSFVILGDFNHDLAYKNDWVFAELRRYSPTIQLSSSQTRAICEVRSNRNPKATHKYNKLIDHIIISSDLANHGATQQPFSNADVINFQLSDHCPLKTHISLDPRS